jgi:hypothetical protein
LNHLKSNVINTDKFNIDVFQFELAKKQFGCKVSIQCGIFTLNNAKDWILNYNCIFMGKYLDHLLLHYIEVDTDSLYFAISSDKHDEISQSFQKINLKEIFYN